MDTFTHSMTFSKLNSILFHPMIKQIEMHLRYVNPNRRLSKVEGWKKHSKCVSFMETLLYQGKETSNIAHGSFLITQIWQYYCLNLSFLTWAKKLFWNLSYSNQSDTNWMPKGPQPIYIGFFYENNGQTFKVKPL